MTMCRLTSPVFIQPVLISADPAPTNLPFLEPETPPRPLPQSRYESCEGLNTVTPSTPGSSYNKYNSLDRRRLSKLSPAILQQKEQPGFMRLSAYVPNSEPKLRPYRLGKEPERRHSSYYPPSSLGRSPSHGADLAKFRSSKVNGETSQNNKNSEYLNPINILGIPNTRRSNQERQGQAPPRSSSSRSTSSTAGRLAETERGNFRLMKSSLVNSSRCGLGSLLNLNKIPHKSSLQRSNSARECGEYGHQTERIQGDYQTPSPADSAVHDLGNDSREESGHAQHVQHAQHAQHEGQQDQSPPSTLTERKTVKKEKPGKKDAVMKVKSFYEAQLKNFQQNAAKMEESLVNQIYQIKKEREKIELDVENLREKSSRQRQENEELRREIAFLRERNVFKETDELHDTGTEGSDTRVADLKMQLEKNKTELEQTKEEIVLLKQNKAQMGKEITRLKIVLEEQQDDLDSELRLDVVEEYKQSIIERDRTIESLRSEVKTKQEEFATLQDDHRTLRSNYKTETDNWLSEKEKVIKYQKQLQLNYVSMYNKNKQLEAEVEQLKTSLQKATAPKPSSSSPMAVAKTKYLSKFSSKFSDL